MHPHFSLCTIRRTTAPIHLLSHWSLISHPICPTVLCCWCLPCFLLFLFVFPLFFCCIFHVAIICPMCFVLPCIVYCITSYLLYTVSQYCINTVLLIIPFIFYFLSPCLYVLHFLVSIALYTLLVFSAVRRFDPEERRLINKFLILILILTVLIEKYNSIFLDVKSRAANRLK